ncbi:hypothetical protein Bhyg_00889 [Pseudolycoriella hygida]|uniref:Uncharacterized protein n=1 Tax=Pseudolycoriella hygida TaxID=35572 RepID=A0A9Q0N9U6_9DIPT|nr:hypothetical protein Bhyg_00889 [Pseudolycoriella hygida]
METTVAFNIAIALSNSSDSSIALQHATHTSEYCFLKLNTNVKADSPLCKLDGSACAAGCTAGGFSSGACAQNRTFSGISSAITKNGSVKTPHEAMKRQNENEAIGIHEKSWSGKPCAFNLIRNVMREPVKMLMVQYRGQGKNSCELRYFLPSPHVQIYVRNSNIFLIKDIAAESYGSCLAFWHNSALNSDEDYCPISIQCKEKRRIFFLNILEPQE